MRGHATDLPPTEILLKVLRAELPEIDPARLQAALEKAVAKAASASLDTEGYRVVDLHLARVEATEEATERAKILRELSDTLEQRGDQDRALVVRLAAFGEAAAIDDLDPLLRLARITDRWDELPLETMSAMVDIQDDAAAERLRALAAAYQNVGKGYLAADCLERVLLLAPADRNAHETLELFYRANAEWPVLVDLLSRRTVHTDDEHERAELFFDIAQLYERQLADDSGALDAYREADRLDPDRLEVVEGMARVAENVGVPAEETLGYLDRLSHVVVGPKARAKVLVKAANIARHVDFDQAQLLYEQARADDPDLADAVEGFAILLRDRGEEGAAVTMLEDAAARPAFAKQRSRWLADAADFAVATGDTERAKALYREARAADPDNHNAGLALVELCWDTGSLVELVPILDELCRTTEEPDRLRHYLIQRSKVAAQLGDATGVRRALSRAVDLDPGDAVSRRELADLLFEKLSWAQARPLYEGLLEEEDRFPPAERVELHFRLARCARELGDHEAATRHAGAALAIDPHHRASLLLKAELDVEDPHALAAHQLALANLAPPAEKAERFAALGDIYADKLGDRATAREMYREALAHRQNDHLLLTKYLELVAEQGDWSYSLDLMQRLIDTEQDPKVRARFGHVAGTIARDHLGDLELTAELFERAVADDPLAFKAADELESLLADDLESLVGFLYRRLEHVRHEEGRAGERLRLWDRLGEVCLELDRRDDALTALEVALSLDADNIDRRARLADLLAASQAHDASAIEHHHVVLREQKRRLASYQALQTLYDRTGQIEKGRACREAIDVLRVHVLEEAADARVAELFDDKRPTVAPGASRPLANEDFVALGRLDVDLQLSALFALVAPSFAIERARIRPPQTLTGREPMLPASIAGVVARVVTAFGVTRPSVFIDRDQLAPCKLAMRTRDGTLAPVLVIGRPAVDHLIDEHELAFALARQLADLRTDRIARLLCPRAGELSQIIELAVGTERMATRWLQTTLHPLELEQTAAIGARLRERTVQPLSAAMAWLAATERAADRIGFVVAGDLEGCVRALQREHATAEHGRVLDLVWASVTEELLAVRARVEGWTRPVARAAGP